MKKIKIVMVFIFFLQISIYGLAQESKIDYNFEDELTQYEKDFQHVNKAFNLLWFECIIQQSFREFLSNNLVRDDNEFDEREANFGEVIQQAHDLISNKLSTHLFYYILLKDNVHDCYAFSLYTYVHSHKHDVFIKNMAYEWMQKWINKKVSSFISVRDVVLKNRTDILSRFIDLEFDLDVKNNNGSTVLHIAAYYGKYDIVYLLLKNRINLNLQNKQGQTPLHFAVYKNRKDIVYMLLNAGADRNIENNKGENVLYTAATKRYSSIIKMLLPQYENILYQESNSSIEELILQEGSNQIEQEVIPHEQPVCCCSIS
jgi:hypothetical protein